MSLHNVHKRTSQNIPKYSLLMISWGFKNEFESTRVNESSVFESLEFYYIRVEIRKILIVWPTNVFYLQKQKGESISKCLLLKFLPSMQSVNPFSYKRDRVKQCRSRADATECGIWSGSTHFALNTGISINMVLIKTNRHTVYWK